MATRQPEPDSSKALRRTSQPGVYRRGQRFVAVYRREGRQHKESAASFAEARAIKRSREGEARADRLGPFLDAYALAWVNDYAGLGLGGLSEATRVEYRRLLITFALAYFPAEARMVELDPGRPARVHQLASRQPRGAGEARRSFDRQRGGATSAVFGARRRGGSHHG